MWTREVKAEIKCHDKECFHKEMRISGGKEVWAAQWPPDWAA